MGGVTYRNQGLRYLTAAFRLCMKRKPLKKLRNAPMRATSDHEKP